MFREDRFVRAGASRMSRQGISALVGLVFLVAGWMLPPLAFSDTSLDVDEAARAFGMMPSVKGMSLSPDGAHVSFVMHSRKHDLPIAMVINLATGASRVVAASDGEKADVEWCRWANASRLLCRYFGIRAARGKLYPATRLVATNFDGSEIKVLSQKRQRDLVALDQAEIVDWLFDDPKHIWMEVQDRDGGEGVKRVNIYTDRSYPVERPRPETWNWISDGRAHLRIKTVQRDNRKLKFKFRAANEKSWKDLIVWDFADMSFDFGIAGFGDDPNDLYVFDAHEGRVAMFRENLGPERGRELVFAHPHVDVDAVAVSLGKGQRVVGAAYTTDRSRVEYFDPQAKKVQATLNGFFPDEIITIVSESWDQRYYLVHVSSDVNAGDFYRFTPSTEKLDQITNAYSHLEEISLAPMRSVQYPSDDGVMVSGYVTELNPGAKEPRPMIVLPHGGPQSRDEWGYDFLVQFLASQGYVVLQSNYRGSGGFGAEWSGDGAYREWRRAMTDLEYGARYLVEQKIADPDRICAVGWSYGGYAALMSALEYPDRYRCAVSIAGVTDPIKLVRAAKGGARRFRKAQIGDDPEVVQEGSPIRRVTEMKPPVLLLHGSHDLNVDVKHSSRLEKAMKRAKKKVEFVEYEGIDHHFTRDKERIDLLRRTGQFLKKHLAVRETSASAAP